MSTNLKAARDTYVATLRRIVTEKEATARAAFAEFETAQAELAAVVGGGTSTRKAAAKPGPKPGRKAKKTATKVTEKKKPGPKPKKTATAKKIKKTAKKTATPKKSTTGRKATKAAIASATQGRRAVAQGLRPPLKEALAILIGSKSMDIETAIAGLNAKGWMPECKNERSYISYALSSNKDMFERVSRGAYKVRSGTVVNSKWSGGKKEEKTATKAAAAPKATKKTSTTSSEEQKLQDLGVGVASNPFMS